MRWRRRSGLTIPPEIRRLRRLLYCAEWIESHALHIYLLHAPDFLGYESGISLAADHREAVERGLRLKKIGNELLEVLGGRAIHPINVTVGGFYRSPRKDAPGAAARPRVGPPGGHRHPPPGLRLRLPRPRHRLRDGLPEAPGRVPDERGPHRLQPAAGHPDGGVRDHFEEQHVKQSNALHSVVLPGREAYLVGPLARVNLCFDQLSPTARREAEACRSSGRAATTSRASSPGPSS